MAALFSKKCVFVGVVGRQASPQPSPKEREESVQISIVLKWVMVEVVKMVTIVEPGFCVLRCEVGDIRRAGVKQDIAERKDFYSK